MDFINYPYISEAQLTLEKSNLFLLIPIIIIFLIGNFFYTKKKHIEKNPNNKPIFLDILRDGIFNPIMALVIVGTMGLLAVKSNYLHNDEIAPKFLSLKDKNIIFSLEPIPDGKKNINDVYSASIFVKSMITKYEEKEGVCRVSFDLGNNLQTIINNTSKNDCFAISKGIHTKINTSKMTDYPKMKDIQEISINYYLNGSIYHNN